MVGIRVRTLVATALLAAAAAVVAAPAHGHRYDYTVESRGYVRASVDRFAEIAAATLSDIRGWTLNHNIRYRRVGSGADFRLILASPEAVDAASPGCSSTWSCRVGNQVLINDERWRKATSSWPYSRRSYRSYVINHELGHWLGLGHAGCPGPRCRRSGHGAAVDLARRLPGDRLAALVGAEGRREHPFRRRLAGAAA